jgi:type I restriction enzyme, S subunit
MSRNVKYFHEVIDIRVSNVDKKIYPTKSLVRLCNYMDAYSNDYISSKISFSTGSADANEIQKFGLKINDVIITKDSETPEDIAVSTVVVEDLKNVVCGYHLAILRSNKDLLDGNYLMLKLKSDELKRYFLSVAKR